MQVMVTGGAGFIGSNFIRHILMRMPELRIVNYDRLTYAGNLENLRDVREGFPERYTFVRGDICDREGVEKVLKRHRIDVLINFAAETHVDRSILDSSPFITTNVVGTQTLLTRALDAGLPLFIQISTDEVYGTLGEKGKFTESSPLLPNSPYAASKAAADHLVRAFHRTYGLPAIITRCSNNYGPCQFPEKLIPLFITNALDGGELPLYGDGRNVRDWIYVEDHAAALTAVLSGGRPGDVYNIGGGCELENREVAGRILELAGKPHELITYVKDRPGHDRRYALDCSRIRRELDWEPVVPFSEGIRKTVQWYRDNPDWVRRVKTGEYRHYYERNYGDR